jgi:hypothetical protein
MILQKGNPMKNIIFSFVVLAFTSSALAGEYQINPACTKRVEALNKQIAASFAQDLGDVGAGKFTVTVNPIATWTEDSDRSKVQAKIKITRPDNYEMTLESVTEVMDLSSECYVVSIQSEVKSFGHGK